MREPLKPGDLVVQEGTMPYPNTIYRVDEVDDRGNFRGTPVFRLAWNGPWKKVTQWYTNHRVVTSEELDALRRMLAEL